VLNIEPAVLADIEEMTDIYNEAILTTTATCNTEPKSLEELREWFESHDERHPILVARVEGHVVGWACLTEWSDRPAYNGTAETSFYVAEAHLGQGIGRALKQAVIAEARRLGYHVLNDSVGFEHVGTLKEVGRKFGKLLDVHIMQMILD
jgi:phosphinothricin acetyltransferase